MYVIGECKCYLLFDVFCGICFISLSLMRIKSVFRWIRCLKKGLNLMVIFFFLK